MKWLKLRVLGVWVFALLSLSFIASPVVLAQCGADSPNRNFFSFPTWDQYLEHNAAEGCRIANFEFPADLFLVALALVEMLIRLSAFIAVGVVIYGGFKFMTSRGQPDKIAEARKTIEEAVIGLVIAVLATSIVSYVASRF